MLGEIEQDASFLLLMRCIARCWFLINMQYSTHSANGLVELGTLPVSDIIIFITC